MSVMTIGAITTDGQRHLGIAAGDSPLNVAICRAMVALEASNLTRVARAMPSAGEYLLYCMFGKRM